MQIYVDNLYVQIVKIRIQITLKVISKICKIKIILSQLLIVSCQGEMESNTNWFSEAKRGVGANSYYLIIDHDTMGGISVPLLNLNFPT